MLRLATTELRYQRPHLAFLYLIFGSVFYYIVFQAGGAGIGTLRHPRIALIYLAFWSLAGSVALVKGLWQILLQEKRDRLRTALPFSTTDLRHGDLLGAGFAWLPLPLLNAASLALIPLASPAEEFWIWLSISGLSLAVLAATWLAVDRFRAKGQIGTLLFIVLATNFFLFSLRDADLSFLDTAFVLLRAPTAALAFGALAAGLILLAPRLGHRGLD